MNQDCIFLIFNLKKVNKMQCPKHPDVWLYENMIETEGFCPTCQKWCELEVEE